MFEPGKLKDLVSKPDVHEPFSLGSLIVWLRTKPADGTYCYEDHGHCLIAQYLTAMDIPFWRVGGFYYRLLNDTTVPFPENVPLIPVGRPRTFGAALSRALAAQAGT